MNTAYIIFRVRKPKLQSTNVKKILMYYSRAPKKQQPKLWQPPQQTKNPNSRFKKTKKQKSTQTPTLQISPMLTRAHCKKTCQKSKGRSFYSKVLLVHPLQILPIISSCRAKATLHHDQHIQHNYAQPLKTEH